MSTPTHIEKALSDFAEKNGGIRKNAKTPAQANLFTVRSDATKLDEDKRKVFH